MPDSQVVGLELPITETMTRREYREELQQPLLNFLEKNGLFVFEPQTPAPGAPRGRKVRKSLIRYAVLCYGVPLRIAEDTDLTEPGEDQLPPQLRRNGAAVDSELCTLPVSYQNLAIDRSSDKSVFRRHQSALLNPTNGLLMVAGLDGPDADIARGLVDKAIEAERDGLWGRAYFDLRGLTTGELKKGDDWIGGAARTAQRFGFETIIDDKPETFSAAFPMSQIALYAGWYDPKRLGTVRAAACRIHAGRVCLSSAFLQRRLLADHQQILVRSAVGGRRGRHAGLRGRTLFGRHPEYGGVFRRWLYLGFTFGEAAYAAQSVLSWQTTVIGDPLYQPFKENPQTRHQQLLRQGSKLIEWSHLRWVDLNLAAGAPKAEFARYLESQNITARSSVLTEKLGDIYQSLGKTQASISAYRRALKLDPTPQQSVRLTLALGDKLTAAGKQSEALKLDAAFLKNSPDYPGAVDLYRKMESLARHLGDESQALVYATQIRRLTMSQ